MFPNNGGAKVFDGLTEEHVGVSGLVGWPSKNPTKNLSDNSQGFAMAA